MLQPTIDVVDLTGNFLLQAFTAFKESRLQKAEQRMKLRRVIGKLSHSALARAFDTWKVCLGARQDRLSRLQAVASRWSRLSLGWAFNSWTAAVAEIADERAARVAKLVPTVRNAFTPTVRAVFGAWWDVVAGGGLAEREQRMLKNVVQRMRLRQEAAAFHVWCEHAQERRRRKCRLVLHIGNRVLSGAFNQWCALVACLHVLTVLMLAGCVAILGMLSYMAGVLWPAAADGRGAAVWAAGWRVCERPRGSKACSRKQ